MPSWYISGFERPRGPTAIGAAVASGTAFDPTKTTSHISLSGNNLIATVGASVASGDGSRGTVGKSTGKYYAEFTLTNNAGGTNTGVGIVGSTFTMGSIFIGGNSNSMCFYKDGNQFFNGNPDRVIYTYTTGDVIGLAVDMDSRNVWWRKGAGVWNNIGGADPATQTSGIAIDPLIDATVYPAIDAEGGETGTIWTANFGASSYAQTAPSGFGNWI